MSRFIISSIISVAIIVGGVLLIVLQPSLNTFQCEYCELERVSYDSDKVNIWADCIVQGYNVTLTGYVDIAPDFVNVTDCYSRGEPSDPNATFTITADSYPLSWQMWVSIALFLVGGMAFIVTLCTGCK